MFNSQNTPFPLMSLKSRALRALSQREYSRVELFKKLSEFESTPGELEPVLNELESKGFLNEERHAESLARKRSEKHGVSRIRQEMKSKGVPQPIADKALEALQDTELERAKALWSKRFGELPLDSKMLQRQTRFMMYRGFNAETVRLVLKHAPAASHAEHEL